MIHRVIILLIAVITTLSTAIALEISDERKTVNSILVQRKKTTTSVKSIYNPATWSEYKNSILRKNNHTDRDLFTGIYIGLELGFSKHNYTTSISGDTSNISIGLIDYGGITDGTGNILELDAFPSATLNITASHPTYGNRNHTFSNTVNIGNKMQFTNVGLLVGIRVYW